WAHLGQSSQLVDCLIKQRTTGPTPLAAQALGIAQALAQFRIQLAIIPITIAARTVIAPCVTSIAGIRSILRIALLTLFALLSPFPLLPSLLAPLSLLLTLLLSLLAALLSLRVAITTRGIFINSSTQ